MSSFSIVLQGPLHPNTVPAAKSWARWGKVIVSTWSNSDAGIIESLEGLENVRLIQQPPLTLSGSIYNRQNVYLQCLSTLKGLEEVDTPLVIKARADTFVGNPEPFVVACMAFPDRYVCSNLHFRPDATFKFHASDKFIGGNTELLRKTFRHVKERCERDAILLNSGIYDFTFETPCPYPKWEAGQPVIKTTENSTPIIGLPCELPFGYVGVYPEVLISTSYLMQKGIAPLRAESRRQMYENFWIVKMEDCKPYSNKEGWPEPEHNWHEIHHINAL